MAASQTADHKHPLLNSLTQRVIAVVPGRHDGDHALRRRQRQAYLAEPVPGR